MGKKNDLLMALILIATSFVLACLLTVMDHRETNAPVHPAAPTVKTTPAPTRTLIPETHKSNRGGRTDLGEYTITFYCSCSKCCGKTDGITASGAVVKESLTVAAPNNLPFGTRIFIEGIGERVVQDRGGSITGKRLDVYVESHQKALQLGVKHARVFIIEKGEN